MEFRGEWWLPSKLNERRFGTLTIDDAGACELLLFIGFGSFSKPVGESDQYPRILGEADGKVFTLEGCFQVGLNHRSPGTQLERIHVGMAFEGVLLDENDQATFQRAEVRLDWFLYWTMKTGFPPPERGKSKNRVNQLVVQVRRVPDENFESPYGRRVTIRQHFEHASDHVTSQSLKQDFTVVVSSPQPETLSELLSEARDIQDLVSISHGHDRHAAFASVVVKRPDVTRRLPHGKTLEVPITVHGRWVVRNDKPVARTSYSDMYFTLVNGRVEVPGFGQVKVPGLCGGSRSARGGSGSALGLSHAV